MTRRIRLRYTGFVILSSKLFGAITGFLFTMLVIRKLPPTDYGLWGVITAFAAYFFMPAESLIYWPRRDIARGYPVAKSLLFIILVVAVASFLLFLISSPLVASRVGANIVIFAFFALQIPLLYTVAGLTAIAYGVKPHVVGYGDVVFEIVKLLAGVFFIVVLDWGILGLIASLLTAYIVQITVLSSLLRGALVGRVDLETIKLWLSRIWVSFFRLLPEIPSNLIYILPAIWLGSTYPVALMTVPRAFSNIVKYTSELKAGLTPKLLSGEGGERDVEATIKMILMLAIPATLAIIVLARPLLYLLRPEYVVLAPVLIVLAVRAFLRASAEIPHAVMRGLESVETKPNASFKDFLKSKHCFLPSFSSLRSTASLLVLIAVLQWHTFTPMSYDALVLAYYTAQLLVVVAPSTLYLWYLSRRMLAFSFPFKSLFKYLIASVVMIVAIYITYPSYIFHFQKIMDVLTALLPSITSGLLSYVATLSLIDREFRQLLSLIAKELLKPFEIALDKLLGSLAIEEESS